MELSIAWGNLHVFNNGLNNPFNIPHYFIIPEANNIISPMCKIFRTNRVIFHLVCMLATIYFNDDFKSW